MENWKAVEGTNGMIEVSDLGRVRSLLRGEPYVLKTQPDAKGYHRLRVTINREKKSYKLHRIVAQAFIPNPDNLPQVNHKDGNKDNNAVSNLEWVTNQQNVIHSFAMAHGETGSVHDIQYMPKVTTVNGKKVYLNRDSNPKPREKKQVQKVIKEKKTKVKQTSLVKEPYNTRASSQWNVQHRKPIIATKGDEVMRFDSVGMAEKYFQSRHICAVLKGKRDHVKGWTFSYVEGGDPYVFPGNK